MKPSFRPAVLLLLHDQEGRLLIGERRDFPGSWQFPQGGIKREESPIEALRRETMEETGLLPMAYRIGAPLGTWTYRFAPGVLKKGFRGQSLLGFPAWLEPTIPSQKVLEDFGGSKEFIRLAWTDASNFPLTALPEFKVALYRDLLGRLPYPPL